jgi:hypothetical protein
VVKDKNNPRIEFPSFLVLRLQHERPHFSIKKLNNVYVKKDLDAVFVCRAPCPPVKRGMLPQEQGQSYGT